MRVMNRIFESGKDFNPDYIEKGFWNFFEYLVLTSEDGAIRLSDDRDYAT